LFTGGGCFAQTDSLSNEYIQKFPDKISTQLFVLNTSNDFTLDYAAEDITVDIKPNSKTTLGIAVQYDIISFSLGFAPKFFADNKDNKDSKMTSFGFSLFPKKWLLHFDYFYQKGMTLETEGAEVYLTGLRSKKLGGSVSYVFNENFSVNALAFQNERQLKSAGTFMPMLSTYYTELKGDAAEGIGGKTYFINMALAPGYSYNWVIAKKFLVAGGASLGFGFTKSVDENINTTSLLAQASLSLSLGYNSETFYGGVLSKGIASSHNADSNVTMGDNISYTTAFFGYRFDAPDAVKREKKKINDKLKL
jgi:hypothetical protein